MTSVTNALNSVPVSPSNRSHACGLSLAGMLSCWGSNGYGQLGNGTDGTVTAPATDTYTRNSTNCSPTTPPAAGSTLFTATNTSNNRTAPVGDVFYYCPANGTYAAGTILARYANVASGWSSTPVISADIADAWTDLSGATSTSLLLGSTHVGYLLRAKVTGANVAGSATATSAATTTTVK
jgi:hypothetical protein